MGEDHAGEPRRPRRLTVEEAADQLGITEGAVRNRIKRGTLRAEREAGRVYVLLAAGQTATNRGEPTDKPGEPNALISQMRDEIAYLREENRRKDHIIAGLVERIPPAIEPPEVRPDVPSGARGSPETASEGPGEAWGTSQREAAERPEREEEPRQRSWWREFFGFD